MGRRLTLRDIAPKPSGALESNPRVLTRGAAPEAIVMPALFKATTNDTYSICAKGKKTVQVNHTPWQKGEGRAVNMVISDNILTRVDEMMNHR